MFVIALVACSGGGDSPPVIDAPTGPDGAVVVDAPAIDAPAVVDGPTPTDGRPLPDGLSLPDGPIGVDCVVGAQVFGMGSVMSTPAGIACDPDCRETVACGSTMTLTAVPAPGHLFMGWQGACSGANPVCTVTANGVLTLAIARFQ